MNLNEIGFKKNVPDTSAVESLQLFVDQCTARQPLKQKEDYPPIYSLFSGITFYNF